MPAGRPKKNLDVLNEGWQDRLIQLGKDGASDVELRAELDISEDLWYRWMDEEPEFSQTVKKARMFCQIWWERQGRKMTTGEAQGNATTWIFNMKNRFRWTDRVEQDNLSSDGSFKPVKIEICGVDPDGNGSDD